jgi:transcriptional regulator with XRE-family HTH domain
MSDGYQRPDYKPTHIEAWRKHRGLSREELSWLLREQGGHKVSASMIAALEQRRAGYAQRTLEALAKALRTTPGALIDRDPEPDE